MSKRKSWLSSPMVNQQDLATIRTKLFGVLTDKFWAAAKQILPNATRFITEVADSKSCCRSWILHECLEQISVSLRRFTVQTNKLGNYTCKSKRVVVIAVEYVVIFTKNN